MPTKKSSLCVLPWICREIRTDGALSVCCSTTFRLPNGLEELARLDSNPDFLKLKKSLAEGDRPKACFRCWDEEKIGIVSRRQKMNRQFSRELAAIKKSPDRRAEIRILDLKVGNGCNQKCLICGPSVSSLWIQEHKKFHPEENYSRVRNLSKNSAPVLRDLADAATEIHVHGGEPFIHEDEVFRLLSPLVASGRSKSQRLIIPTNGSAYPRRLMKEIFPFFQEVRILMSADGVGAQFEYQRYPGKWDRFLQNYRRISSTPFFWGISLTLSALNAFNLSDYLRFWDEQGEHRVWVGYLNTPKLLAVACLPKAIREETCQRLLQNSYKLPQLAVLTMEVVRYLRHFPEESGSEAVSSLMQWIEGHDRYRNLDFSDTFKEYSLLLKSKISRG